MKAIKSAICPSVSIFPKLGMEVPGKPPAMNLASVASSNPRAASFRTTAVREPPAPCLP